jgi:putative ABC transport system permease protein
MIKTALKGLAARRTRGVLTALAIVVGVAMISAAFTFTDTMRGAADSLSSAAYDKTDAVVVGKSAYEVSDDSWATVRPKVDASLLAKVRAVPQVKTATGDITNFETKIIGSDGKPVGEGPYFGVGLDTTVDGYQDLTPFRLDDGRWANAPNEVVIDAGTAKNEDYGIGDKVTISVRDGREYTVTGIARFGDVDSMGTVSTVIFDHKTAQQLYEMPSTYDSLLVAGKDGVPAAEVRSAVAQAVGQSADVQTAAEHDRFTLDGLKMFISIIQTVLLAFGFVAVGVGAFTIFNTLSITVAQRTREFGLLRMVGASRKQVLGSVVLEAVVIGFVASAIGLIVGLGLAKGLDATFSAIGLDLPTAGTVFATRTIVVAMLVGVLVTTVAGLLPAWRATKVAPVAALRAADPGSRKLRWTSRLVRAFAGLVGRPAEKLGGSAGKLARRNAMRNPGRTAVTAAALMIGVALVTLVTVVGSGLKDTTTGSLERRIDASFVANGVDGWSPIDEKVEQDLASVPGVTASTSIRQDGGLIRGDEEIVNSIDPALINHVYRFDWKSGDDSVASDLKADGAIVDEGWATEQGLGVGDAFKIKSVKGEEIGVTIRGIEDSSVLDPMGLGPVTISDEAFDSVFSAERNLLTFVAAPESARDGLESALGAYPDAKVETIDAFITERASDVDMLLAIFYVLLALAVIVSLFGIVNTLVLSTFERTRELGMLRAVGMSRRQVRRMIRHESIITAVMGAFAGMVVGIGLAYLATSLLADEGLTFVLPVGSLIAFTIVAIGAGVVAAILPARRAAKLDVLNALAYE